MPEFKFLEDNKCYQPDISLIRNSLPKLKDIIQYGPLPQDFSQLKGDTRTNNLGIVSYKLDYPSLKVEKAI